MAGQLVCIISYRDIPPIFRQAGCIHHGCYERTTGHPWLTVYVFSSAVVDEFVPDTVLTVGQLGWTIEV